MVTSVLNPLRPPLCSVNIANGERCQSSLPLHRAEIDRINSGSELAPSNWKGPPSPTISLTNVAVQQYFSSLVFNVSFCFHHLFPLFIYFFSNILRHTIILMKKKTSNSVWIKKYTKTYQIINPSIYQVQKFNCLSIKQNSFSDCLE